MSKKNLCVPHRIPCNTIPDHTIQFNTNNTIKCHTIQYKTIPKQYHTIQCHTIQYSTIQSLPLKYNQYWRLQLAGLAVPGRQWPGPVAPFNATKQTLSQLMWVDDCHPCPSKEMPCRTESIESTAAWVSPWSRSTGADDAAVLPSASYSTVPVVACP